MNGYAGIFGDPIFSKPPIPSLKGVSGYVVQRRPGLGAVDIDDPLLCRAFADSRGTGSSKPSPNIAMLEKDPNESFRQNGGKYEGLWEIGSGGSVLRLYDRDPHPMGFVVGPQLDREGKVVGSVVLQKDPSSTILRGRRRTDYYDKVTNDLKAKREWCTNPKRGGSGFPHYNDIMVVRFPNDANPQTAAASLLRVNGPMCGRFPHPGDHKARTLIQASGLAAKYCSVNLVFDNQWKSFASPASTQFEWALQRRRGSFRQAGPTREELTVGKQGEEPKSPAGKAYEQQKRELARQPPIAPTILGGEQQMAHPSPGLPSGEEEPTKPKWLLWAGVGGLGLVAAFLVLRK